MMDFEGYCVVKVLFWNDNSKDILFESLKNQVIKLISSHATFDSNSAFAVQELFYFI